MSGATITNDELVAARRRDLPALALVVGAAMATRPCKWLRWPLAVLSWPMWLMLLSATRRDVLRLDHHALVSITPPGRPARPGGREVLLILLWVIPLSVALIPLGTRGSIVVLSAMLGAFLLTNFSPYRGRLWTWPGSSPWPPADHVAISLAASIRPSSGLLAATAAHVTQRWSGVDVALTARDADLLELYARWGFSRVDERTGRMLRTTA